MINGLGVPLSTASALEYCKTHDMRSNVTILPCIIKGLDCEIRRAVKEKMKLVEKDNDVKAFMECENVKDGLFEMFMEEDFCIERKVIALPNCYDEIIAPLMAVEKLMGRKWLRRRVMLIQRFCTPYLIKTMVGIELSGKSMKAYNDDLALDLLRWTKEEDKYLERFLQLKQLLVDYIVRIW